MLKGKDEFVIYEPKYISLLTKLDNQAYRIDPDLTFRVKDGAVELNINEIIDVSDVLTKFINRDDLLMNVIALGKERDYIKIEDESLLKLIKLFNINFSLYFEANIDINGNIKEVKTIDEIFITNFQHYYEKSNVKSKTIQIGENNELANLLFNMLINSGKSLTEMDEQKMNFAINNEIEVTVQDVHLLKKEFEKEIKDNIKINKNIFQKNLDVIFENAVKSIKFRKRVYVG